MLGASSSSEDEDDFGGGDNASEIGSGTIRAVSALQMQQHAPGGGGLRTASPFRAESPVSSDHSYATSIRRSESSNVAAKRGTTPQPKSSFRGGSSGLARVGTPKKKDSTSTPPPQGSFRSSAQRSSNQLGGPGPESACSPAFGHQSSQDLLSDEEEEEEPEEDDDPQSALANGHTGGLSKEEQDRLKAEEEEEERKRCLQLYVFVAKCIAYHFNAKQPTDMAKIGRASCRERVSR